MYLQRISVRNFRNLASLDTVLLPGLNTIVGPNNIGKTNLFLAIRHCLGSSSTRGDQLILAEDDIFRLPKCAPTAEPIRVDLTFADLDEDQIAQFFEIVDFEPTDLKKSTAKIHFEATWSKTKRRFVIKRWGGPPEGEHAQIPMEIVESLPVTFLPALRDAETALGPGNRSRLARVLEDLSSQESEDPSPRIEKIFSDANELLRNDPLILRAENKLQAGTKGMAGSDYADPSIRAATADFSRVLRTLRILIDQNPVPDLSSSGLGYNNLIYIATVITQLEIPPKDECPTLLIEEPEAHLHPQWTVLLGSYLAKHLSGDEAAQVIVSTHSPTFAANVKPSQVSVMFKRQDETIGCNQLGQVGLEPKEERQLQRMLDITRATLYFSKGLILVEGISEALIVPELAKRLGHSLSDQHVSVLPICGVAFETLKSILGPKALGTRVALVTDSDPPIVPGASGTWKDESPKGDPAGFEKSPRTQKLITLFENHPTVRVFCSDVTLEYDLAGAGKNNPKIMTQLWTNSFKGKPETLNADRLAEAGDDERQGALIVWRGICRASHSGSKAEFAHLLAEWLADNPEQDADSFRFAVPDYLKCAIEYVIGFNASPLESDTNIVNSDTTGKSPNEPG